MPGVQSIQRAFSLLRALAEGPAGVTELAGRVDLPKSTVARILDALTGEGVVGQKGFGGAYHLADALNELASAVPDHDTLVAAARPHLEHLADAADLGVGLAVLDDSEVVYLDHVDTDDRWDSWAEKTFPPCLVPSGLALLAGEPPRRVEAFLADAGRPGPAPGAVRARLDEVCRTGHLWSRSPFAPDLVMLAAPVWADNGSTLAAVHLQGPAERFAGADEARMTRLLRSTADHLSDVLN